MCLYLLVLLFLVLNTACNANFIPSGGLQLAAGGPSLRQIDEVTLSVDVKGKSASHGQKVKLTASNNDHSSTSLMPVVINIIADLCPHGMLPLAFGLSEGGLVGVVPATLTLLIFGSLSGFAMKTYANLASEHKVDSISGIWAKVVGQETKWMISASLFALCFGCCVFYSAFVGDIFATLVSALPIGKMFKQRTTVLILLTLGMIWPLCMLEDLSALEPTAKLGVIGIMYTTVFTLLRAFDGSYAPGSEWMADMGTDKQPSWPEALGTWNFSPSGILVLVNMLCVAFLAHYNAISYYQEIPNRNPEKFSKAVNRGFLASMLVFLSMMYAGYSMFGATAQPLLLNNFHPSKDYLATGARIAIGMAIVFAYPLMFNALKTALYNLLPSQFHQYADKGVLTKACKNKRKVAVTSILALITAIGVECGEEDVSLVLGLVGSVLGTFFAYTLPGYMALKNMKLRKAKGLKNHPKDILLSHIVVPVGLIFGVFGVALTLREHFEWLR